MFINCVSLSRNQLLVSQFSFVHIFLLIYIFFFFYLCYFFPPTLFVHFFLFCLSSQNHTLIIHFKPFSLKKKKKVVYFWLCFVFIAARAFLQLQCTGSSLQWLLLLQSTGSRVHKLNNCGTWAQSLWLLGSRTQIQQLWSSGSVALWHVGSSQTRDRTYVSCIGRRNFTTEPPGKPKSFFSNIYVYKM